MSQGSISSECTIYLSLSWDDCGEFGTLPLNGPYAASCTAVLAACLATLNVQELVLHLPPQVSVPAE